MAHGVERADGLHQQRAVVELTRPRVELAADDFVVDAVVARDGDLVDREGAAFEYFDFEVDGVGADNDLRGVDLRHEVALVLVERLHRHVLGVLLAADAEALVHGFLVVGVARMHAEHVLQLLGVVDRVAHPRDVADVVFVALREVDVDAEAFLVDRVDRVAQDGGVAEALRVVEVDQQLLVLLEVALLEFGVAQEVEALLVRLLEGAAQAFVGELFVAREVDAADAHARSAIDHERDVHGIRTHGVVLDARLGAGVAEALLGPVGFDELAVLVDHVVGVLRAAAQLELLHEVLLLALGDALEVPAVYPGAFAQEDFEVGVVAVDRGADPHVGEQTLVPQAVDGRGDKAARKIDRVPDRQSGRGFEHLLVEVADAVDADVAESVEAFLGAVEHGGVLGKGIRGFRRVGGLRFLGGESSCRGEQQQRRRQEGLTGIIH